MKKTPSSAHQPVVRRSRGISVIWSLPLLAVAICGWLLFESIQNAGIEITIYFDDARGITASKTQVMSKGIPVGLVEKLEPDIANNRVKATVIMNKELEPHLVTDTLFWMVQPEISATSIRGLETIISGSYIAIRAGNATTPLREFKALPSSPSIADNTPGLHLQLSAEELGSIQKDTGIYFKNIQVGSVQEYSLAVDNTILINIHILPEYAGLIRKESRFYNASGLTISGKLPDLSVQIESLASLLRGGILVHTPKELSDSPQAESGQLYTLYKDLEAASFGIPMTLQLSSGSDITEGKTKLKYRGIEAGFVKEIQINDDAQKTVTAHILLDPRAELILRENTIFWLVKPAITPSGVRNLRTLLTGPHITFQPGDGNFTNHFKILADPPPQEPLRAGSYLQLESEQGVNLAAGTPVYFKDIQVGEVVSVGFAENSHNVSITIFVYEPYKRFVDTSSVFWLQSGVEVSADITGVKLHTGPLARMLSGGIVFTTPDLKEKDASAFPDNKTFPLYTNYSSAEAANMTLQPRGKRIQIQTGDSRGLSIGTPLLHRQIKVGHITGFSLAPDRNSLLVDCFVYEKYQNLINSTTKFYSISAVAVSGGLNGINLEVGSLESMIKGGIGFITSKGKHPLSPETPFILYPDIEQAIHSDDTTISINFKNVGSLKTGSLVRYRGVTVGKVTQIGFGNDTRTVNVQIRVEDAVAPLFRSTTRIWQVQPEVSLSGFSNIDAVLGSYITFLPGAGKPERHFTALATQPQDPFSDREGLPIILETSHLGSLSLGSPIYYRELKIGEVTGFELSPSFQQVYVFIVIAPHFSAIIRENTKFWNISGAKVSGGLLSGITLSTGSLTTIVSGGIALSTPDRGGAGKEAIPGQRFILHDDVEKVWLDWNPDIVLLGE